MDSMPDALPAFFERVDSPLPSASDGFEFPFSAIFTSNFHLHKVHLLIGFCPWFSPWQCGFAEPFAVHIHACS